MLGGMPSVHSALAFSVATIVMLLVPVLGVPYSMMVIVLAYFLALMVAQSRVAAGIHTFTEATTGALLGIMLTLLLYHLYRWAI
jgi:diacylglycerol kinase (ATP)